MFARLRILQRDIEQRLAQMRFAGGACRWFTISSDPRLPQPERRVDGGSVLRGDEGWSLLGDAAQHGIDQPGVTFVLLLDQRDGGGDSRMRRHGDEQQLRGAEAQDIRHGIRRTALDEVAQHEVDLTQTPQRRRHQQADEGPVARFETGNGMLELFVCGFTARKDALDDGERRTARCDLGKWRCALRRGMFWGRHGAKCRQHRHKVNS